METPKKDKLIILIESAILLLGGFVMAFSVTSFATPQTATHAEDDLAPAAYDPTLSLALSKNALNINLTPTLTGMQSTDAITATVETNNYTGYTLYMSATTENTSLLHNSSAAEIPSTTNSSLANLAVNTWGYNTSDVNQTTFLAIPPLSSPAVIATKNTQTGPSEQVTLTYGAKANFSLKSGNYSNTLVFTGVANALPLPTISSVSPSMAKAGDVITISGSNFFFDGNNAVNSITIGGTPCTSFSPETSASFYCVLPTKPTGNSGTYYPVVVNTVAGQSNSNFSVLYGPPPIITGASGTMRGGNTITLTGTGFYDGIANSEIKLPVTIGNKPCYITSVSETELKCTLPTTLAAGVQTVSLSTQYGASAFNINYLSDTNFTSAACSNLAANTTAAVTDNRNNQNYTVKKMSDGNCWMISNLRYLPQNNAAGTYKLATNGNYMTADGTDSRTGSNLDTAFYYNVPDGSSNHTTDGFFGYLYNWYGASAGTGNSTRVWLDEVESSVCPSPFELPSGNVGGDFSNLDVVMGGPGTTQNDPTNPPTGTLLPYLKTSWFWIGKWQGVYAGFWFSSHVTQYEFARYWSSTVNSYDAAYNLSFDDYGSTLRPGTDISAAFNGFSVRCVLKP